MMRSRVLAAALAVPMLLACAWLSGGFVTDPLVGEGAEGRAADRALLNISTVYGVGGGPWEYTGPPLVVEWRVEGVGGCSGAPPGATSGSYRAEVEGYWPFGIPRGEALLTCGGRDEDNLRWEPYF